MAIGTLQPAVAGPQAVWPGDAMDAAADRWWPRRLGHGHGHGARSVVIRRLGQGHGRGTGPGVWVRCRRQRLHGRATARGRLGGASVPRPGGARRSRIVLHHLPLPSGEHIGGRVGERQRSGEQVCQNQDLRNEGMGRMILTPPAPSPPWWRGGVGRTYPLAPVLALPGKDATRSPPATECGGLISRAAGIE